MTNNEKVFHPSLGICTVTCYDRKSGRVTMISEEGNQSVIPYSNLSKAGVRELMDTTTAEMIIERIFHPIIGENFLQELTTIMKMRDYTNVNMEALVDSFIYLLNWKYTEGKKGMKNQECLNRIQDLLCEELAFVLDIKKDLLVHRMITCYEKMA